MKAVIVKFDSTRFSFKTQRQCMWCRRIFWGSPKEIKDLHPDLVFYPEIIPYSQNINNILKNLL